MSPKWDPWVSAHSARSKNSSVRFQISPEPGRKQVEITPTLRSPNTAPLRNRQVFIICTSKIRCDDATDPKLGQIRLVGRPDRLSVNCFCLGYLALSHAAKESGAKRTELAIRKDVIWPLAAIL